MAGSFRAALDRFAALVTNSAAQKPDILEQVVQPAPPPSDEVRLFVPPGHFYSPIVNPKVAKAHLDRLEAQELPSALPGLTIDRDLMVKTWDAMVPFLSTMPFTEHGRADQRYKFDNDQYSWGDGSTLHAMLRSCRPKRVIEIGSGWSSACMVDTAEKHLESCRFTFIEPYPAMVEHLVGKTNLDTTIISKPVQEVSPEVFGALESGDILFIDSTHVLSTGSDVAYELFELLPRVASGVIVHIHDMFWPFEYPRKWVIEDNRSWNELQAVRAFLTQNNEWEILFFNDYFWRFERPRIEEDYATFFKNPGGALWLRRR